MTWISKERSTGVECKFRLSRTILDSQSIEIISLMQIIYKPGCIRFLVPFLRLTIICFLAITSCCAQSYKGFDKNEYPGDAALPQLRKSFSWTGYWLNNPPGSQSNSWQNKREILTNNGFGFALLFNGKGSADLKSADAQEVGRADGAAAVESALQQGFSRNALIFLDIEEGGRLLSTQKAYLFAWADTVTAAGFRAGVYCSGIPVPDGDGKTITTAQDIVKSEGARHFALWIAQDSCPPSPGCVASAKLSLVEGGTSEAIIWQYAQSPRRPQFASSCANTYESDGSCYAPNTNIFVDLNVASSADPSETRTKNAKRTPSAARTRR
jgi:hypothetical protein